MDILKPSMYWVGKRCYRVMTHQVENSHHNYAEEDAYSDNDNYNDEAECGADGETDYPIEQLNNGKFKTGWHVPSAYYAYIIGAKGATRKRLENESNCSIVIPPRGTTGDVLVIGNSISKVRTGRLKVELLIEQARRKMPPTHFVSVAANSQNLQQNFLCFKTEVLERCNSSRGVTESIFQEAPRLHLTIGVMALIDDQERATAVQTLQQAVHDSASLRQGGLLRLRVRGLHYFNDDPSEVSVLYGGIRLGASVNQNTGDEGGASTEGGAMNTEGGVSVAEEDIASNIEGEVSVAEGGTESTNEENNEVINEENKDAPAELFQDFADYLVNSLTEAGVISERNGNKVKLHLTLLNTKFLQKEDEQSQDGRGSYRKPKETFDARDILEHFSDYDFGDLEVREVQLSVMHTRDTAGYYTASTTVPLSTGL